ncbi:hypothetical protein COU74_01455 [Candidatus Peregrinibacteria bacterium CG10_big_fil_rev_8_21_14_0_10_36_19]|nr:MAG: hypothetical protein COU74_01455 [Candidatus Peregrinibacteria bacterium CG10_big_fil_rev_8_21_14_0_10_36_19]
MNKFILYIALINLMDLIAIISAKYYNITQKQIFLYLTILFFGGAGYFFAKSLKFEGMAITNILWIAISVILISIIGYFFFKEEITPIQIAGIITITTGLVLINLK